MQYLYIDESGSMTTKYVKSSPCFVIAIIRTEKPRKLRTTIKRFVKNNLEELKSADTDGKMFVSGSFREIKGSAMTPDLKRNFVEFFCRGDATELYYIVLDNHRISDNLYDNTARAFNFVLKLALEYFINKGYLPDDEYCINLDERNERTNSRYFLQNYLNTELQMNGILSHNVHVEYFDSSAVYGIQAADVLANLYFSQVMTSNYEKEFQMMKDNGYSRHIFKFPKFPKFPKSPLWNPDDTLQKAGCFGL